MTALPVLVVQHQDDCPPARFGTWITEAGLGLDVCRPDRGDVLPADLVGHSGLLVLGGSMGADEHERTPWLPAVKDLVRTAVAAGVPVLGICLGHQIVAAALGGTVEPNPAGTQRGILDVGWLEAAVPDLLFEVRPPRAAHWNNDVVVAPPPGSVVLARAAAGEIQALRFSERAWGIQSHPEIDQAVLGDWVHEERGGGEGTVEDGLDDLLAAMGREQSELLAAWRPVAVAFTQVCEASA